ncbi:protein huluwa isoform X1 [Carassius gibelio]|uniref:protein huluwa isoform X1 n=1 Tax=Carassius gibelio TaxID=101364 RepID=UPI002277536E|nr:protein huluwa isoform X1 [Carassius gibelio]
MSQLGSAVPSSNLPEGLPVSSLALLILLLIPCVLLLLLLNCLFVGYKLFRMTQRKRDRFGSEISLMHSSFSTRQRVTRFSDEPLLAPNRKTNYVSVSEPMLAPPISSSLTSSAERRATGQRARFVRPDGATYAGPESLRARVPIWRTSAPVLLQSSDSDTERVNTVPPNSPAQHLTPNGFSMRMTSMRRSSTMELENAPLDKLHVECESASIIQLENSCYVASPSPSAGGSGLDSDFGASAGVSLRILSVDSDGFPGSAWASVLEWDYYDPSYVTQNHIPKHRHHAPPITTKQYWV